MKAVAATLLNQPNRSGRDYRGIISEYQDKLFQEDHDVRLYYSACYLYYRLDYMWRNQKIDAALKIYRYYILAAIGAKVVSGGNVFNKKKSEIESIFTRIVSLADNEEKFRLAVGKISKVVESQVAQFDTDTRERLRDVIRSETFAKAFDAEVAKVSLPV